MIKLGWIQTAALTLAMSPAAFSICEMVKPVEYNSQPIEIQYSQGNSFKQIRYKSKNDSHFKDFPCQKVYRPFSEEARDLFIVAAQAVNVPVEWAWRRSLHKIVRKESNGRIGIPNYTINISNGKPTYNNGKRVHKYPEIWPEIHRQLKNRELKPRKKEDSTATGLGQLILGNVKHYYPSGVDGMGECIEEAAGMLAYIKDRHGNPDRALARYGKRHEGY